MKRGFAIAAIVDLVVLAIVLHTSIKDFLWTHLWWLSSLVALPAVALAVLTYLDWRDSRESNGLRIEADELRTEIDLLNRTIFRERLQHIAENAREPLTQAEQNAAILRRYLGVKVSVTEEDRSWGEPAEIVEVTDDPIVTLFTARSPLTSTAFCVRVHCNDLQITGVPEGSCPLGIKVLRHYGQDVQLGKITKWADRPRTSSTPDVLPSAPTPVQPPPKSAQTTDALLALLESGEAEQLAKLLVDMAARRKK